MVTCLSPIWQHFATLQNRCNSATLNSQAWGADEAIEAILDDMANGLFETNPLLMLRRFDSLQSNRSKKYSQRRQILARRPSSRSAGSGKLELSYVAACRETLQHAQKQVRLEDWQLLLAIGVGYTYQEVEEHVGHSPQYLKPKVSRLRAHLILIISGNAD
jgi:hypothetical protein